MYFEYGFQKGRGRMRIRRELAEKGVAADVIEIAFGQRTMKVEVLNIAEHTLKADASALYKEL